MSEVFSLERLRNPKKGSQTVPPSLREGPGLHLVPPPQEPPPPPEPLQPSSQLAPKPTPQDVLKRAEQIRQDAQRQFEKSERDLLMRKLNRDLDERDRRRAEARTNGTAEAAPTTARAPHTLNEETFGDFVARVAESDAPTIVTDIPDIMDSAGSEEEKRAAESTKTAPAAVERVPLVTETARIPARTGRGGGDGPSEPPRRDIAQQIKAAEQRYAQEQQRFYAQRDRIKALSGKSSIGLFNQLTARLTVWRNREQLALAEAAAGMLMQRMKDIRREIDGLTGTQAALVTAVREQRITPKAAAIEHARPLPLKEGELRWTPADLQEVQETPTTPAAPTDNAIPSPVKGTDGGVSEDLRPTGPTGDAVNAYYQQRMESAHKAAAARAEQQARRIEELRRPQLQEIQGRAEAAGYAERTQAAQQLITENRTSILRDMSRNNRESHQTEQQWQRVIDRRAKIQSLAQQIEKLNGGRVWSRWLNSGERLERETELAGLRKIQIAELKQTPSLVQESVRQLIPSYEQAIAANDQAKIAYLEGRLLPLEYEELRQKAAA